VKPLQSGYTDEQIRNAREVMDAARSILNIDHNEWKRCAALAAERHVGKTADEVAVWCVRSLVDLRDGIKNLGEILSETVPLYLAIWQWGRDGFPHFSLSEDFFFAMASTDFGDPTEEPLYMPFQSFTLAFPASAEMAGAQRAFVYQVPSIRARNNDFDQGFEVEWALYRATLMLKPPEYPVWTQWPIGMTRAALLDENRLLQADMGHDTIEYKGDEAQPELRGAELAKAVSDKLPASALTVATQIATTLEGLPNDTRLRILDAFAEQYLEAEKTGVRPEQVKLDVSKLKLSKNEMKIVARNVREQANRSIIEKDDPTAEELLALSASQKKYTAKLRLLLANVMSYVEASGKLPSERQKGASNDPVVRLHATQNVFEVGRAIKLDGATRAACREGTGTAGWKLIHKFLVRGHWRNQVYGEGRALRRRQFIQPFYKGPKDVIEALNRTYEVK
jgi:hypothetical protein